MPAMRSSIAKENPLDDNNNDKGKGKHPYSRRKNNKVGLSYIISFFFCILRHRFVVKTEK